MSEAWTGRFFEGKPEEWNNLDTEPPTAAPRTEARAMLTQYTYDAIKAHVAHAREKHPHWRKTASYALDVAKLEFGEFEHAVKWEGQKRQKEEALDLIAVLVRFVEGDAE